PLMPLRCLVGKGSANVPRMSCARCQGSIPHSWRSRPNASSAHRNLRLQRCLVCRRGLPPARKARRLSPQGRRSLRSRRARGAWGTLEGIVVDRTACNGDGPLTIPHQGTLKDAVLVSTQSDVALLDAPSGIAMFCRVNVRVLGLVANIGSFHSPACGGGSDIF